MILEQIERVETPRGAINLAVRADDEVDCCILKLLRSANSNIQMIARVSWNSSRL